MTVKKINLALQGGGAHGAFTWGVLDRVLQDERIEIAAMSGTSAGALNAAALKAGMVRDGRTGAREALDWLWTKIAGSDGDSMAQWLTPFGPAGVSRAIETSLHYAMGEAMLRMVSPYGYGPLCSEGTFGHSGAQSSCAFADPAHDLVVVWICNGLPGELRHQERARAINQAVYQDIT